jgi:carboxylesterase type B
MWTFLLLAFCLFVSTHGLTVDELEVHTPYGLLKGFERDHYTGFEGIPYAEKPIEHLRFEPPVPFHTKWEGVREASHPGKVCIQWDHFTFNSDDKLHGSEDCLYLNIYTPKGISATEKLPVIFHIHGGALMFGHGNFYGPEFITTRPLILVTFNYRVGPMGFISSGCHLIPGNMGMKDQNLALRWVKQNIGLFGGDSEKITLTGFSAGGASVHLHHLSELSAGLFHNGISHSGTALDPWIMQRNADKKFIKVAELVGCGTHTTPHEDIVKCLKTKPAEDIVKTVKEFQPFLYNPFQVFGVVVEPEHHGHHKRSHHSHTRPFLTDYPSNLIKNHHIHGTSWLVTETKDEGLYPAAEWIRKPDTLSYIKDHWNEVAPYMFQYVYTIPKEKHDEVSRKIREHYLGDKPINELNYKRFVDISTDRFFHLGCDKSVKLQGKQMPVYVYYYNYKLSHGVGEYMAGKTSDLLGVSHGDDVLLLYFVKETEHELTEGEKQMQEKLLDLYVSFAKTGVPKFGDLELTTTVSEDAVTYTEINAPDDVKVKTHDNIGDHKFWETLGFNEP